MTRRVFFSFHYDNDVWRASQVRNSWVTKPDREAAGFWDSAEWEKVKAKGEGSIQEWINKQLEGTSVTVVLIGSKTACRKWITYEIKRSCEKNNGLLGIYVHNIKDKNGKTDNKGDNPFAFLYRTDQNGNKKYLSESVKIYDWIVDDGYNNLGKWIEGAAK